MFLDFFFNFSFIVFIAFVSNRCVQRYWRLNVVIPNTHTHTHASFWLQTIAFLYTFSLSCSFHRSIQLHIGSMHWTPNDVSVNLDMKKSIYKEKKNCVHNITNHQCKFNWIVLHVFRSHLIKGELQNQWFCINSIAKTRQYYFSFQFHRELLMCSNRNRLVSIFWRSALTSDIFWTSFWKYRRSELKEEKKLSLYRLNIVIDGIRCDRSQTFSSASLVVVIICYT